jgi:endoglucanase
MMQRRGLLLTGGLAGTLGLSWVRHGHAQPSPLKALKADDFRASGLRGVGFGQLDQGSRSSTDHDAVRSLGVNHVRVFIQPKPDELTESYNIPAAQLAALDATLAELERRGIYLVLVASFGQDARGPLFKNTRLQASVLRVWQQLAQRLKGRAVVAGFDIVNEPVPPGFTYGQRQDRWLDFASRVIDAVRAVDPQRVLIVESAPDATGESFANMRPLSAGNLVYSVHSYAPFDFTHQAVAADHPQLRRYPEIGPDGKSSTRLLTESLDPVVRFATRYDVPIYVGEFSAVRWALDGSAARYVADSIALFQRQGWSWSYHEYRAWHGWDAEIASLHRDGGPRSDDAPVLRVLRAGLRAERK